MTQEEKDRLAKLLRCTDHTLLINPLFLYASPPFAPSRWTYYLYALIDVGRAMFSEDWADAQDAATKDQDCPASARVMAAHKTVMQAILDGLPAVYRSTEGAEYPITEAVLAQDGVADALLTGSVFRLEENGRHKSYESFVCTDGLNRLIARSRSQSDVEDNPSGLSDYMRLALYVHNLGYGPSFKGNKKTIIRELFAHAARFGLGDGKLSARWRRA
jgi:hypothetical protein